MERKYDVSRLSAVGICLVEKCIILHYFFNIVCAHAVCQTSNFSSYIPNPASGNISELNARGNWHVIQWILKSNR